MLHGDLWKVGLGFRGSEVQRFRVQGSGFRVQGSKVQGLIAGDYIWNNGEVKKNLSF